MRFLLFALVFVLCGCSPAEKPEKTPQNILSLSAAATRILCDLGTPPRAIDEYGVIALRGKKIPVIGKGSVISREKVLELGIDCVILWDYQADAAEQFRRQGIRVEILKPFRLNDYPELIRRLGSLTDTAENAARLCSEFEKERNRFLHPARQRKVYFELYGMYKAAGRESYIGELLSCSGGESIVEKTGLVSSESLLSQQPEIIFYVEEFGSPEEIRKRPGFAALAAVKKNRICAVPRRLITEGLAPLEAIQFFRKHISQE